MLVSFARFMTLSEWFWWYLWLKMAFKMSQEFLSVSALAGTLPINYEMKELCQLCGTRVRLSEIKHVSVGFTLLRCYTFMLKKFTFSLSKNTELPASLDVFLSLFLSLHVFSLCVDDVPPRRWTKFPQRGRNSPKSHTSEKECFLSYLWH